MKVGELRRKLLNYPDDYEVKIEDVDIALYGWAIHEDIEEFEEDKVIMLIPIPF